MPVPRGAGQLVDLNQNPDALRPRTTQNPGLIKKVLSAYTGGMLGKGPEDPAREGTGRTPPATGGVLEGQPVPERSGWDTTKQVLQTVFPGAEPYFKAGQAVGDYLGGLMKQGQAAQIQAGYAPSSPPQATIDWAQQYLNREAP